MILKVKDLEQWKNFVANLSLIAPGKGDAKKTVSKGFARIWQDRGRPGTVFGMATDDIMSVVTYADAEILDSDSPAWITPADLKDYEVTGHTHPDGWFEVLLSDGEALDFDFDKMFWEEHVWRSLTDAAPVIARESARISPDRLRKFSLLKPQGKPVQWTFVEWADRDIIKWHYGENVMGIYVLMDQHEH